MKFYLCYTYCHHKNEESIKNMIKNNNSEYEIHSDLSFIDDTFDIVICFDVFYPPECFPERCKVIYGPHFFVFPDESHPIFNYNYDPTRFFYNALCEWNYVIHKSFAPHLGMRFLSCPFGIDLESIEIAPSIESRKGVLVYVKGRLESEVKYVLDFLDSKEEIYSVVRYGSYKDSDFKQQLQLSKYVIWIGRHESQGFALQETLASNIPVLLWDVKSMYEEYGSDGKSFYEQYKHSGMPLLATATPYWSDECGVKFYEKEELNDKYNEMNTKSSSFNPRSFIEKHLSHSATYKRLLQAINIA